ncbi:uncharacterized protein METZ01_LOCUS124984 [marine metagenome]|uniref:Uncharacterized protein n=1 Tax=marine metagenome TaxID=408172 RepID=A0A381Y5H6_9ZZZZ|tara:strand:+ start:1806 stop:2033 length:228 start_codon:yes stop_codon:yes gene_type:complete
MKGSKYSESSAGRTRVSSGKYTQCCPQNGGTNMAKSKPKPEKREETTAEFVKRLNENKKSNKRNGLKRRTGHHHR